MAVGTKELASANLRGLDDERLVDELRKAKEELFNHGRLRAVKKDIARIYTEMRERELGIATAPAPEPAPVDPKAAKKAEKAAKKAEDA
jgi:large subunit ribosomal protein L29